MTVRGRSPARPLLVLTNSVQMQMLAATTPEAATRFLQFVNASPTPFHAVYNAALRLESAGFTKVCHHVLHCQSCLFSRFTNIDQREG